MKFIETNDGKTIRVEYREENGTIYKVLNIHLTNDYVFPTEYSCLDNKNLSKSKIESFTNCC